MPAAGGAVLGDGAVLERGEYRAVLARVGGSLRSLTYRGRDLVRPWDPARVRPAFRGAMLAPWPNRLPDGRWDWHGEPHRVPVTEPSTGSALHGLVAWADWQVEHSSSDRASLSTRIWPQPGYPFDVALMVAWELGSGGLAGELTAVNRGAVPAPIGIGFHPYLQGGDGGRVDDWELRVPADVRFETDDRQRMVGEAKAPAADADFRRALRIGAARVDHCYGSLDFVDGWCESTVVDAYGDGASLGISSATPWLQVHTSDHDADPEHYRRAVAIEPMTCPPEALASGRDLVVLEPGGSTTVPWSISAI